MVAWCEEKYDQEKDAWNDLKRVGCINIRGFWRRGGLFTHEWGGKRRKELKDGRYIFGKKVWKSFERSKQKDYKHSQETGRVN